jgi:hypothetical protein
MISGIVYDHLQGRLDRVALEFAGEQSAPSSAASSREPGRSVPATSRPTNCLAAARR